MLLVIPGSDMRRHAALMERAFQFRHKIFVDEKGWSDLRGSRFFHDDVARDTFHATATHYRPGSNQKRAKHRLAR